MSITIFLRHKNMSITKFLRPTLVCILIAWRPIREFNDHLQTSSALREVPHFDLCASLMAVPARIRTNAYCHTIHPVLKPERLVTFTCNTGRLVKEQPLPMLNVLGMKRRWEGESTSEPHSYEASAISTGLSWQVSRAMCGRW